MPSWPTDRTSMEDAIYTAADTVLTAQDPAWDVAWDDPDFDRPTKPFALLSFLDAPQAEAPATETLSCPVPPIAQNDVRTPASMILQIQLFADSDQEAARAVLRQSLIAEYPHREALTAAGWGVGEIVSDADLSSVISGRDEYRGLIEIRLRCTVQHTIGAYPWIETANPAVIGVS